MINLPNNINYTLYEGTSGMSTKHWGPSAWNFLFISIMGRYPFKLDVNKEDDIMVRDAFKSMLTSLEVVMPCIFCRESFKEFLKELPIDPYLVGRIELMYWLYQMKDKVNKKLLKQENQCYNDEKKRLKVLYYSNQISDQDYYKQVREFKQETFQTIPTPPFKEILDKYESLRAVCSKKAKTCALPKKK